MKAVILAGGKGTRLAPYTTVFPKPLVPLGNQPILEIIIRQLVHHGFTDIVLSVGHLAELIQAYFQNGNERVQGTNITYVRERCPLGTVGALALVPDLDDSFLVMNGDVLTSLDYAKLMKSHRENGGLLTIAMHKRQVKIDLGLMEVNERFELQRFVEKPTLTHMVSMGVYIYEPEIVRYIQPGQYLDFPDLVQQLLRDKRKVVGHPSDDYWLDLGSHADYAKAVEEFEQRKGELLPNLEPFH